MKRKIAAILCCGLIVSNLGYVRADEILRGEEDITKISVESSGIKKAEYINSVKNEKEHEELLEQVMDGYYNDDGSLNCDLHEYEIFKSKLKTQDKEIVDNYEEAADERKMADSLDYCVDEIAVNFDKNVSDDDIKLLLSDVAEDVVVDNFSLDVDEDLPEGRKAKIREAQKIITDKTAFVKLKSHILQIER